MEKNVSFKHLRVFGCWAFGYIPKDERSKLDVKSKQCIFLGYGHKNFDYRLYNSIDKKVIRSKDVVILEDIEKCDNSKSSDDIPSSSNLDLDQVPIPVDFNQGKVETEQREDIDGGDNPAADEPEHEAPPTPSLPPQDEFGRST
mgnify:CR=1 FL=1